MTQTITPAAAENAIAFGGKHISVSFRPTAENPNPADEKVFVPLLEVDPRLAQYIAVSQNEPLLVEWLLGKPEGWARTLMPASLLDIVEMAHTLNFTTARRWAEHRAKVAADLVPLNDRLESVQGKLSPNAAHASG